MKKFLKEYQGVILLNILLIVVLIINILYSLTYKDVPITAQHQWYGTDLHTYLISIHAFLTGLLILVPTASCIACAVINKNNQKN